jgi:hypothetical protein
VFSAISCNTTTPTYAFSIQADTTSVTLISWFPRRAYVPTLQPKLVRYATNSKVPFTIALILMDLTVTAFFHIRPMVEENTGSHPLSRSQASCCDPLIGRVTDPLAKQFSTGPVSFDVEDDENMVENEAHEAWVVLRLGRHAEVSPKTARGNLVAGSAGGSDGMSTL